MPNKELNFFSSNPGYCPKVEELLAPISKPCDCTLCKERDKRLEANADIISDSSSNSKTSMVFRPKHYTQYTQEPFTFFFLNNLPFAEASVCKYILRWRAKNGIDDLNKAKRIIDMMIEMETNKQDYIAKKTCL